MPRRLFTFDEPDRFVAGAIGQPGSRTFFLQARKDDAVVSVSLEKAQVEALAARMGILLETANAAPDDIDDVGDATLDHAPLDEPLGEVFRVGVMAIRWDEQRRAVLIEAQPLGEGDDYRETPDDDPAGPDLLRVRISPNAAASFVVRAASIVAGGRPTCPFCGQPLDPNGHFCPRTNGHLN